MIGAAPAGLRPLLELESAPGFRELACPTTGILAWPAIRNDVFRLLLSDRLYRGATIVDLQPRRSWSRIATGVLRATAHNLRHPPERSEVLIISTGGGLLLRDGLSYNRIADPFAEVLGDRAWSMEGMVANVWPAPARWNARLGFLTINRLYLSARSRISIGRAHRTLAAELVGLVTDAARDRLDWDLSAVHRAYLLRSAVRRLAGYPLQARQVARLIHRVRPRIILLEEACYGPNAVFNAVARQRGVHVTEFQHGLITPSHDVYNVHQSLRVSPNYQRTLPNAILTYGTWWNSQFNVPIDERVAIGNPYRSQALAAWHPGPVRDRILVLGDGVQTGDYLDLCADLAVAIPSTLGVAFRPHPRERATVASVTGRGFSIDAEPDLYQSLTRAAVVLGESSTAMYEAVGLVRKVFAWDTPKGRFYLGEHPFGRFSNAAELADLLRQGEIGEIETQLVDSVWTSDWRRRFVDYVSRVLSA